MKSLVRCAQEREQILTAVNYLEELAAVTGCELFRELRRIINDKIGYIYEDHENKLRFFEENLDRDSEDAPIMRNAKKYLLRDSPREFILAFLRSFSPFEYGTIKNILLSTLVRHSRFYVYLQGESANAIALRTLSSFFDLNLYLSQAEFRKKTLSIFQRAATFFCGNCMPEADHPFDADPKHVILPN